ncbi:MAG: nucleotidyltransferase family protein [Pirellulales bacterium]
MMVEIQYTGDALWARMERAVERVTQRMQKSVRVLDEAQIPYAVVGGNAVRAWVAQIDEAAVRTTKDVDILIRPEDLPRMIEAMKEAGFHHRQTTGVDMFVEHEDDSARDAVHVILSGKMVREDDYEPNPDVEPCETKHEFRTLQLETLIRMKLNSYRLKDRVHLVDMIEIGLIDETWPSKFPEPLGQRLQRLIDDPDA